MLRRFSLTLRILFQYKIINKKVAEDPRIPAFTYGQLVLGISKEDLSKIIPSASYTTHTHSNGRFNITEHNKTTQDDANNNSVDPNPTFSMDTTNIEMEIYPSAVVSFEDKGEGTSETASGDQKLKIISLPFLYFV